jgi:hypothetical protein
MHKELTMNTRRIEQFALHTRRREPCARVDGYQLFHVFVYNGEKRIYGNADFALVTAAVTPMP